MGSHVGKQPAASGLLGKGMFSPQPPTEGCCVQLSNLHTTIAADTPARPLPPNLKCKIYKICSL